MTRRTRQLLLRFGLESTVRRPPHRPDSKFVPPKFPPAAPLPGRRATDRLSPRPGSSRFYDKEGCERMRTHAARSTALRRNTPSKMRERAWYATCHARNSIRCARRARNGIRRLLRARAFEVSGGSHLQGREMAFPWIGLGIPRPIQPEIPGFSVAGRQSDRDRGQGSWSLFLPAVTGKIFSLVNPCEGYPRIATRRRRSKSTPRPCDDLSRSCGAALPRVTN